MGPKLGEYTAANTVDHTNDCYWGCSLACKQEQGIRTIDKYDYGLEMYPVDEEHCSRCKAETHEWQCG